MCLVLLSMGQQQAGQSKDGCDSLRQLLLTHTCLPPGKGTQNCSPLLWVLAEGGELPGCMVRARMGQEWPEQGSCPHWIETAVQRGFAFEEALALLQRRELGLAFSLGALPPPRVVLF